MFLQLHIQTVFLCECKETSPPLDLWDNNGDKRCVQLTPGSEETARREGGLDSTHSLICMESNDVISELSTSSQNATKCTVQTKIQHFYSLELQILTFENSNECEI